MTLTLDSVTSSLDPGIPPSILLYGVQGVGKSTLAASAPNPIALDFEGGLHAIPVRTFGLLSSFKQGIEAVTALVNEPHEFQTLLVDSLDAFERHVWDETCKRHGWRDIEAVGFGKGYFAALDPWRFFLDHLSMLRTRGMAVILIAHAEIKRFDSPETEPFDRYQPRLQARASALIQERVDCAFFAGYRMSVAKSDVGFNKTIARGVGTGERVLYTTERPSAVAKNRFGMPDVLPLQWDAVAAHIPYFKPRQNDSIPSVRPRTS